MKLGTFQVSTVNCMFPKSTHATFSMKLFQNLQDHPRLEKAKFSETDFMLSHYAGKVAYQTNSFLDKNRDYVVLEHCNLLASSKCSLVSSLFPPLPEESTRSSYKFNSVASRFKQQLQALMETLNLTEPHYIRCVKPNSFNRPQKFENPSVLHQLRCGGVLEAVRISLAGYPTRRTYSEFVDRFGLLAPEFVDGSYDEKEITGKILHKLNLQNFQLGKSKVFLRAGQVGVLDSRRAEVLDSAAKRIQGRYRTYVGRREFILIRGAAITLQTYCRGCIARRIFRIKQEEAAAVLMQTFIRGWISRRAYMQLYSAATLIQSSIRGFSCRQTFLFRKRQKAATLIQSHWRMWRVQSAFMSRQASIIAIQCLWRRKLAKRELSRLKREANEAGALRLAKTKLEKQLEDFTWKLHLEKRLRVTSEEAKALEISKLQKIVDSLNHELEAANSATINESQKNAILQSQLESSQKEKSYLEQELSIMEELRKENAALKESVERFEKKSYSLELELAKSKKDSDDTSKKLHEVQDKYSELEQNLRSLKEKLKGLEEENHVLRQKAFSASPKGNHPGFAKAYLDNNSGALVVQQNDSKPLFESPIPSKLIPLSHSLSESRRKLTIERNQENYEFLLRCIKENLGFKDGKPVSACLIYKCLSHWHAFESERTAIFDYVIDGINEVLKVGDENVMLPYWLSNASALLCLIQKNSKSNGFLSTAAQHSVRTPGLSGRVIQGLKSPFKYIGGDDGITREARYPAMLFKQQLTALVEKIFGLIRDNLKKEISPLLNSCIQAPKSSRGQAGKHSKSPEVMTQQSSTSQWDGIVHFLDSLMSRLRSNHVPSFFIRKLITQVFSFINISLFNSLLLRRECCTFSNGEYMKSGLAELEKWIANATEEYAGTSWHELNYIRQAVGFLVIHQKRKKSLQEIRQDLCPMLTVRQIYRICTMYWDDKYGTQTVSNEVVAEMREIVNKDNMNLTSNSFLLDDDLSIPFSTEDVYMAIPEIVPTVVELPTFVSEYPSAQFLVLQK
uniref:Uncharacterized protein n=2 Tax=Kalanchoe fedtschenkoi TaxID=63787 RepID=A0A7N0VDA3_KALFE